jgi:hypothetical protein
MAKAKPKKAKKILERGRAKSKAKPEKKALTKPRAETQLELITPVKLPGGTSAPRHTLVIREIRSRAGRVGQDFMVILRLCDELVNDRLYERAGFETPGDLFEKRVPHLSWPTVRRYLGILEGVRRLAQAEREAAMLALQGIGVTRAGVIAPLLGVGREDWKKWVERAKTLSEEDLRAAVHAAIERQPALPGVEKAVATQRADEKWLRYTIHAIEPWAPDAAKEFQEVFAAGRKAINAENWWSVLFAMISECASTWHIAAAKIEKDATEAAPDSAKSA